MFEIRRGLVVWAKLVGDGSVQKGTRPCIVVQNDKGNKFSSTTIVIPLTKKTERNGRLPTHVEIKGKELGRNFSDSIALTEQIRVIDKKSIVSTGNVIPNTLLERINQAMMISQGINNTY